MPFQKGKIGNPDSFGFSARRLEHTTWFEAQHLPPVRSRFEIIRRLDIGCVNGV